MKNRSYYVLAALLSIIILVSWKTEEVTSNWGKTTPLSEVLISLGEEKPHHYRDVTDKALVKQGYDLITKGQTIKSDGKKSKRISKFFVCTDCHNIQREDPDLTKSDPETRLLYAEKNDLPFLQGTTLWGIVNRRSWYNDDYIKKYGDLVLPTNDTLINAIDLCCYECSKGRHPKEWEVEAMLAYLHSIQINLGDLDLTDEEFKVINSTKQEESIALIKSKYLSKSPATFLDVEYGDNRGFGEKGNPQNGKKIYERSCLHCHIKGGVTNFELNKDKLDYKFLERHLEGNSKKSLYVITRGGTYSKPVYKPYMPNYTKERMSEQQLEDLVAYTKEASK